MKRIKAINGYTIYQATAQRDADNYNCEIGEYSIYLSTDIRDFGLANSYPEYDRVDSLSAAVAMCNGSCYAVAVELAEELSDSTVQDMDLVLEIERRLEAGEALETVRDSYDIDEQRFVDPQDPDFEEIPDDETALMDYELLAVRPGDYLYQPSGIVRVISVNRSGSYPSFEVEYPNGTRGSLGALHASRMLCVTKYSTGELREAAAKLWESLAPRPFDLPVPDDEIDFDEDKPCEIRVSRASYAVLRDPDDGQYITLGAPYNDGLDTQKKRNDWLLCTVARHLAFSDCGGWELDELVIDGEQIKYVGWQPGMLYEFQSVATGQIVWSQSFPQWDH